MRSVELKPKLSQDDERARSVMQQRPLGTFGNKRSTLPAHHRVETMASTNMRQKSSQASARSSIKVYDQHLQNSRPSSYSNNFMRTLDERGKLGANLSHAKAQTMQWNEFMDQKITEVESQARFRNTEKKPRKSSMNDYAIQEVFNRNTNNTVIS